MYCYLNLRVVRRIWRGWLIGMDREHLLLVNVGDATVREQGREGEQDRLKDFSARCSDTTPSGFLVKLQHLLELCFL